MAAGGCATQLLYKGPYKGSPTRPIRNRGRYSADNTISFALPSFRRVTGKSAGQEMVGIARCAVSASERSIKNRVPGYPALLATASSGMAGHSACRLAC